MSACMALSTFPWHIPRALKILGHFELSTLCYFSYTKDVRKVRGQSWQKLPNSCIMYETDIFVRFKFRFIGMHNFITKEAQMVITQSHPRKTKTYTRSIEMNFWRTLSDFKHATLVNYFTYQLSSQFVLSLPNFYLSEFSTPKSTYTTHILIMG
jgi:hypothetical protein